MIQEIINFTQHLKKGSPWIFEHKVEASKGIHIFIELDSNGNLKKWPPIKGEDWDYFDGKKTSPFLEKIKIYEKYAVRVGTTVNKVLDRKKQIFSCSPFIVSFKKQSFENPKLEGIGVDKVANLLNYFSENAISVCLNKDDETGKQKAIAFKNKLKDVFHKLDVLKIQVANKEGEIEEISIAETMKKDFYLNFYFKNIEIENYKQAHEKYLQNNLFNTSDYNSEKKISSETYGLSGFYNGLNTKKPFLQHKTATHFQGISSRIQAKETVLLNDFDILLRRKVFPQPLPIFIDKAEFKDSDEIIKIFKENEKLSYSQILKQLFKQDENRNLKNYYLLFFNYKSELEDFDFVSKFEYKLEDCKVQNLFKLKSDGELLPDRNIHTIFGFESNVVKEIFNNSLVRVDFKTKEYKVKYFDEIKAEYVSGGELVYQMILKYRKTFYDYIYKSKRTALNGHIWDEIMWNTIIADLRNEKYFNILEKLNIWFSLYNFFDNNNLNRDNMASLIPQLTEKMREVANNDNAHFANEQEFAFGAGQVIYYLLTKSASADKKHSLLEPFLQKVKAEQLQNAVGNMFGTYKHEIGFGQGRFERLAKEVLAFETEANLKNYQRFLLAGYFAPPVIFEKSEKSKTTEQE